MALQSLGPGSPDSGQFFKNRVLQCLFARLMPNQGDQRRAQQTNNEQEEKDLGFKT